MRSPYGIRFPALGGRLDWSLQDASVLCPWSNYKNGHLTPPQGLVGIFGCWLADIRAEGSF